MTNLEIKTLGDKYLMGTYSRLPIAMVSGKGAKVTDADGNVYLDFVAGVAVNCLGHGSEVVTNAIKEQADKMIHCSNLYYIETQAKLAEMLCKNSCMDKVFFCNSGAEANECAIKLARKYAKMKGYNDRYEVITMIKSFHGRTLATLTATGQDKVQVGFDPLPSGFSYVPFNDIEAIEAAVSSKTCAIMVEPVQGEGGVTAITDEYFAAISKICKENDILLICDEVQVGLGRTGKLFAYEHSNVEPDIMTLAKALGGGVPVGACLAKDSVACAMVAGDHGSTFGGNPLVTAVGCAVVDEMIKTNLADKALAMGEFITAEFEKLKEKYSFIKEIRGKGLLLGMEIDHAGANVVKNCLEKGLLINCTAGTVLRFVPPLNITKDEVMEMIEILDSCLELE